MPDHTTVDIELTRAIEHLVQAGTALRMANSAAGPVLGILLIELIGRVSEAGSRAEHLAVALRQEERGNG